MAVMEESLNLPVNVEQSTLRRRVFGLAWPVIAENGLETLLGIVDTFLVAHLAYGAVALSGVGSAVQVMQFLLAALAALSIGASVLVAQAVGARDVQRANTLARQALLWSVVLSVPLALGGLLIPGLVIGLFGLEPAAADIGVHYMRVTMGTAVVLTGLYIGGGVLRGAGDSRTPMLITTAANVINIPLAYGLIYGQFGLPALGAVGSAWATFIARGIALVALLAVLWRGRNGAGITIRGRGNRGGWRLDAQVARRVLAIGVPAALEQVLVTAAFFAGAIAIGHLGTTLFAANRIYFMTLSLSFLPGIGFAVAATALMGQSVGAKRIAEGAAAVRLATWGAVVWMGGMAALICVFAPQLMRAFTADAAVIETGAPGLRAVALAMPALAVMFVQAGGLRGCGDTRTPLWIFGLGVWVSIGLGTLALLALGGGLVTTSLAWVITAPAMAWLMASRFRRKVRAYGNAAHAQPAAPL
jgi:putative MATE family efflux protein